MAAKNVRKIGVGGVDFVLRMEEGEGTKDNSKVTPHRRG